MIIELNMSIVGRGRGRGFAEVRETTLRRPGQPFPSKYNDLISLIDNLIISDTTSGTKIDDIAQTINEATKNNTLKEVFDDLHKQALEDRQFGIKLAIAFSDSKVYSINDCNLRLILLQTLQKDYEDREEVKKNNILHFRNAISLLGEVYNSLKLNGRPMGILAPPLLQYLEMLLEASEEEDIELATTQISINGRKVYEESPVELEDFIIRVRAVLINRNLSARSRGMLLFIIDLANQRFAPLSGKLQEFYVNELGTSTLVDIQRHDKDLTVNTKLENNVNDKDSIQSFNRPKNKPLQPSAESNTSVLMKAPKHGKNLGFGPNEKSPPNAGNERTSVPRAIRGAGAVDNSKEKNNKKSPRGRKDKLTDEQIWSSKQNTSSKVWGHDDRFDKDYD